MSHSRTLLFTGAMAVAVSLGVLAQGSAGGTLDIYFVDTEGGQATLYVTPAERRCSSTPATPAHGTAAASWPCSAWPRSPRSITCCSATTMSITTAT